MWSVCSLASSSLNMVVVSTSWMSSDSGSSLRDSERMRASISWVSSSSHSSGSG